MNNKKIFSFNLFFETFKQIKAVGIIGTLLMAGLGTVPRIFEAMEYGVMMDTMGAEGADMLLSGRITTIEVISEYFFLCFVFLMIAPLLTMSVLKFLNDRKMSDFYHSLSYTRICLYVSRILAVIAWIFLILVASYIVNVIAYTAISDYFRMDFYTLFRMHLSIFIGSLLVVAAFSVGCSITGNGINNIVVSGLILLLPRGIIQIITGAVQQMTMMVPAENTISFINHSQNIVASWIMMTFMEVRAVSEQQLFLSVESNIYTFVLALIYMVLGFVLFKVRKSEAAGKSLCNSKVSFVVKAIVAGSVAAVGIIQVIVDVYNNSGMTDEQKMTLAISVFTSLVVSMAVVVIYEYASVKKAFKYKSTFLSILAGWGGTAVIGIIVIIATKAVVSYVPSEDDVNYVKIMRSDAMGISYDEMAYYDALTSEIKYKDDGVIRLITDAYKCNVDAYNKNEYGKYDYYESGVTNLLEGKEAIEKGYIRYKVYFADGLFGKYRYVYLTVEEAEKLSNSMIANQEYRDAYSELPKYDDAYVHIYGNKGLTKAEQKLIYESFLKEQKKLKFEDYYKAVYSTDYDRIGMNIYVEFTRKGYLYAIGMRLDVSEFPETVKLFYSLSNKYAFADKDNIEIAKSALAEVMKDPEKANKSNATVGVYCGMPGGNEYITVSTWGRVGANGQSVENSSEIINILYPKLMDGLSKEQEIDVTNSKKALARIELSVREGEYNVKAITYYVQLDDVGFEIEDCIIEEKSND